MKSYEYITIAIAYLTLPVLIVIIFLHGNWTQDDVDYGAKVFIILHSIAVVSAISLVYFGYRNGDL